MSLGQKENGRRQKHIVRILDKKVKYMKIHKQLLFLVGSDEMPQDNDFSPKQITIMQIGSDKILIRLKFNDDIVFFNVDDALL